MEKETKTENKKEVKAAVRTFHFPVEKMNVEAETLAEATEKLKTLTNK